MCVGSKDEELSKRSFARNADNQWGAAICKKSYGELPL